MQDESNQKDETLQFDYYKDSVTFVWGWGGVCEPAVNRGIESHDNKTMYSKNVMNSCIPIFQKSLLINLNMLIFCRNF